MCVVTNELAQPIVMWRSNEESGYLDYTCSTAYYTCTHTSRVPGLWLESALRDPLLWCLSRVRSIKIDVFMRSRTWCPVNRKPRRPKTTQPKQSSVVSPLTANSRASEPKAQQLPTMPQGQLNTLPALPHNGSGLALSCWTSMKKALRRPGPSSFQGIPRRTPRWLSRDKVNQCL